MLPQPLQTLNFLNDFLDEVRHNLIVISIILSRRRNHQSFFPLKPLTVPINHYVEIRDENIMTKYHQLPYFLKVHKVHKIANKLRIAHVLSLGF